MISKTLRDKLSAQALQEIEFARNYKQKKTTNWSLNESLYYGTKLTTADSRANVSLGRTAGFLHTLLSKINKPLIFKFQKSKASQLKRVMRLNSLREIDAKLDHWNIKNTVGKKQGGIYGRAIYAYHASSDTGYKAHLENVDVYDFLIDPSCGGIDLDMARYMGRYNIIKDKSELQQGAKDKVYIREVISVLTEGAGNSAETLQEEQNKSNRANAVSGTDKEIDDKDKFKFWEWFTTYEGEKYYLLMTNNGSVARCELLKDVFESDMWPFWSWAYYPDLTEFWTPSPIDYIREVLMAGDVCINQMLDNAEAINKPQKVVDVIMVEDLSQLKYRRDGLIISKGGDATKAVQILQTPSINTPIQVFNILNIIQQAASGVTEGAQGISDEGGKVGIYEGNQAAAADRFRDVEESFSFGYERFGILYKEGVKEHLVKKIAIDIMGPDGIETQKINRKDIFKGDDDYSVIVEASNADAMTSIQDQRVKINFLSQQLLNPTINQKKAFELQASIAGFSEDEIKQLLDTSVYGTQEIISEAERDIESLLDGEEIKPNQVANIAYKQHFIDYLRDHTEDMDMKQFTVISAYIELLNPIIIKNETRAMNDKLTQEMMANPMGAVGADGKPIQQPNQPNIMPDETNLQNQVL